MVQPTSDQLEITVDHATTAGACGLIASPWLANALPALQAVGVVVGIAWIIMQMYYKIKKG